MNILLTGITGNLGFEIAHSLNKREVKVLPVVRDISSLARLGLSVEDVVEADLTNENLKIDSNKIDCIVHSAGNVLFEKFGDSNSKMMQSIIKIAKEVDVPIYYVSTAFLWRESGSTEGPRNAYESDKLNSEKILKDSGVPHTIFRPSVLVGDTESGQLRNWSGYYLLVNKFIESAVSAETKDQKIRFPLLTGTSNMLPVDQAAETISQMVVDKLLDEHVYVTNPEPPKAQWVLDKTLEFFDISDRFEFLPIDFSDYVKLERTNEEKILSVVGQHFSPYWSLSYNFPDPLCSENLITKEYLRKTLSVFQEKNKIKDI